MGAEELSEYARDYLHLLEESFDRERWGSLEGWSSQGDVARVREILASDYSSGLWVALASPRDVLGQLLGDALGYEDVSSIRWWVVVGVAGLGAGGFLDLIDERSSERTDGIHSSFYWLPEVCPQIRPGGGLHERAQAIWAKLNSLPRTGRRSRPF